MKQIFYLLIMFSIGIVSCQKESTANRPINQAFDTTGYFRFSDSSYGYYGTSKILPQTSNGKVDVIINSHNTPNDYVAIYNMPQNENANSYFRDYNDFEIYPTASFAEAFINGKIYRSKLGGLLKKTGLYSFTFTLKFDNLSHSITGYGNY